jgi:hypothetical protein
MSEVTDPKPQLVRLTFHRHQSQKTTDTSMLLATGEGVPPPVPVVFPRVGGVQPSRDRSRQGQLPSSVLRLLALRRQMRMWFLIHPMEWVEMFTEVLFSGCAALVQDSEVNQIRLFMGVT